MVYFEPAGSLRLMLKHVSHRKGAAVAGDSCGNLSHYITGRADLDDISHTKNRSAVALRILS